MLLHHGANRNPLMSVTAKFKQLRPLSSKVEVVIDSGISLPIGDAREPRAQLGDDQWFGILERHNRTIIVTLLT